ncbi:hypothetical protein AVEN_7090-1 [Araneus ventricosus]|uniref:Helitron helicase-like domain-containing protein n=1 Tax=Araneus ventricosus TaxID=182803 RepID=A0A4Y2UJ69_ARAVE|nr:hypothetical protein AVEN_7090-1 [Araneus ventricosus]
MNLSRAVGYIIRNEQRRTERSQETVQESTVRRSIRNEADNRRRPKRVCIRNDVEGHNCGTMSEQCGFCGAVYWKEEKNTAHKYTKCCQDGKVQLPAFPDAPELLKALLTENSPDAKNYRQRIREYNSAFAFASMGAQIKPQRGTGPYCYRLHGQVYHRVSPLYASDQHKESYGQLYIFDSSEATEKRLSNNQNCLQHVFEKLDFMLREINPFAQSYLQMHRLVQEHPTTSVKMVFWEDKNLDMRRYNAPTLCAEVAAIFVGDNGEPPANRDICVYPVGDTCQSISPLNQFCDPMTYLLLFPRGECSWNTGMEHVEERRTAKPTRVTQLQYYAYRLSQRNGFSILHNSGKLFQQYIVDVYVKAEGSRLHFLRQNQKDLRIELYRGLLDALECRAHNENIRTGKRIILSSSFQGSPRHMQQNYQDVMAMVRKFGKPDLFLTFTCNPSWSEILNSMEGVRRPEDRPDIIRLPHSTLGFLHLPQQQNQWWSKKPSSIRQAALRKNNTSQPYRFELNKKLCSGPTLFFCSVVAGMGVVSSCNSGLFADVIWKNEIKKLVIKIRDSQMRIWLYSKVFAEEPEPNFNPAKS